MILLKKLILSMEGYTFEDSLKAVADESGAIFAFSDEYWENTQVDNDPILTKQHMKGHILKSIESIKSEKLSDGFVTLTMGLKSKKIN